MQWGWEAVKGGGESKRVAHTAKGFIFPSLRLAMSVKGHSGSWSLLDELMSLRDPFGLKAGLLVKCRKQRL